MTLVFMSEVVIISLAQVPRNLSWYDFAFADQDANLSVQSMLSRGLLPTVRARPAGTGR
jgi:hypothetical protein